MTDMTSQPRMRGLSRRALLSRTAGSVASLAIGANFICATDAAWALEVTNLKPETMASLIVMARDIYPHDRLADSFYAAAVKGYDTTEAAAAVEEGIAGLDAAAQATGHASYAAVPWEADRVAILRSLEDTPFFQTVRGGLITGLYNQKEVWPLFGYEGESYSFGGYINRGFDDISWL
jgi:hypothetical protein